ncbi:hypothetical protein THAOC_17744 [Thalassiosira oceanica]|uniref:Uncharacterized protein n=1 Tax=Thalassiosira oceanica TaxID=159749 RepID=K0S8Y0_THAOC|nr:hypothetical protein THAOC_17744 [Thalassiosira oceanica]|eukprot:EJK61720.1 hypothetical protein THAOC_17744 [Thalassiosira oceanica]
MFVGPNWPTGQLPSSAVDFRTPFHPQLDVEFSHKKCPEAEVATGFPNCLRAGRRSNGHLSNSHFVRYVLSYENGSDVAPAGAQEFERHPAMYGQRAPVGHFGSADAELRTKPAGPKSEQPTENGPVATSLGRVQFEQNHSLRWKVESTGT